MRHVHGGDISGREEVLDFSANINPLGMPEAVKRAALAGVASAQLYPQPFARSLCEKIAEYESAKLQSQAENVMQNQVFAEGEQHGAKSQLTLDVDQVFAGNGAADLLFLLTRALKTEEGIVFTPAFAEYEAALQAQGSSISLIPLNEDEGFSLKRRHLGILRRHLAAKEEEDGRQTRVIFVCQPGNPTGTLMEEDLLEERVQISRKFEAWLVIDACFVPLLEELETARQEKVLAQCLQYERAVILRAFTKAFAMPGLRLGYLVCRDTSLIARLKDVSQPWSVSLPAMKAGLAALEEQGYLRSSRAYLQKEKEKLLKCMRGMAEQAKLADEAKSADIKEQPGLIKKVYGSAANYIFFRGESGLAEMLEVRGILIRDCSNYTGLEPGYYRVAVRTTEENDKLIQELREIAGDYHI